MGNGVLSGCSAISELTIPFVGRTATPTAASSTTVFGYIFGSASFAGANKCNQYYSTSQYTTVYLPESLKALTVLGGKLMYGALNGCTKLVEVTLGDKVTYVGQTAFKTCVHLTKISLGTDITYIGTNAFQDCNMLTDVYFNSKKLGSFSTTTAPFQNLNVKSVLIGEAVERIPGYMFYNCTALENVIFVGNSACTEIMSYAFRQCTALKEITLPESLVTLNRYAFRECTNLITLTLNSSNLPDYTTTTAPFMYTSIKTLNIGSNVQRIPAYMLYSCPTLETVNFMDGSSCTEIGNFAFRNCKALKQIKLPAGLKTIGEAAFLSCTALTAIELPDTLTALGMNCFNSCTSLKTVYYTGTSTQWQIVENIAVIPSAATVYYVSKMPL